MYNMTAKFFGIERLEASVFSRAYLQETCQSGNLWDGCLQCDEDKGGVDFVLTIFCPSNLYV